MPEVITTYHARARGLWNREHEIEGPEGRLGRLLVERSGRGLVVGGRYTPDKGEVLLFRRDPGILRSQFSFWTEGREWLGSSLRPSFWKREIAMSTGNKPYRMLPTATFGRGWRMLAPKTGEMARFLPGGAGRRTRIEVYRRVDPEVLVFGYFLGSMIWGESWWPSRADEGESETVPTPSKA